MTATVSIAADSGSPSFHLHESDYDRHLIVLIDTVVALHLSREAARELAERIGEFLATDNG